MAGTELPAGITMVSLWGVWVAVRVPLNSMYLAADRAADEAATKIERMPAIDRTPQTNEELKIYHIDIRRPETNTGNRGGTQESLWLAKLWSSAGRHQRV